MVWSPQVRRIAREGDGADVYVVGHRLVDEFLRFAAGRARPNTVRAYAHDLKAFFTVIAKEPVDVRAADVFAFVTVQRRARVGAENVVRISDGALNTAPCLVRVRHDWLAAPERVRGSVVAARRTTYIFSRHGSTWRGSWRTPGNTH